MSVSQTQFSIFCMIITRVLSVGTIRWNNLFSLNLYPTQCRPRNIYCIATVVSLFVHGKLVELYIYYGMSLCISLPCPWDTVIFKDDWFENRNIKIVNSVRKLVNVCTRSAIWMWYESTVSKFLLRWQSTSWRFPQLFQEVKCGDWFVAIFCNFIYF